MTWATPFGSEVAQVRSPGSLHNRWCCDPELKPPGEGINIPRGHENGGILKVIERVITPNKNEDYLSIMLDDMIITNDIQANLIINYLSTSFKLNTNLYRGI
ncbi:hypothetical protein BRN31_19700 [Xanthomonas oryzae pv. oryzae]|nr:hypothetical protein BRN31_19700 [Xanthomonas oryzae pv. oryzae]RBL53533.1 hypothetical protein BRN24_17895 [Xanthomonas oryzae pv. oryzae]